MLILFWLVAIAQCARLPQLFRRVDPRPVYAIIRLDVATTAPADSGGEALRGYPTIFIGAGNGQPAMAIGFDEDFTDAPTSDDTFRVTVYSNNVNEGFVPSNGNLPGTPVLEQNAVQWGSTTEDNAYFYDADSHTGVMTEFMTRFAAKYPDSTFDRGKFLRTFGKFSGMELKLGSQFMGFGVAMCSMNNWDVQYGAKKSYPTSIMYKETTASLAVGDFGETTTLQLVDIHNPQAPRLGSAPTGNCGRKRQFECTPSNGAESDSILGPKSQGVPGSFSSALAVKEGVIPEGMVRGASLGRVAGILSQAALVTEDVVKASGLVGAALGAAFVIVDIIAGQHQAAILGAAGLALTAATAVLDDNPITFFIGVALGAILAILPGLFGGPNLPSATNATQILSYAMYGDPNHQDNAACQQGTTAGTGNPNCTILYNAGVLSQTFQWNNLQAIGFLLQYNQGYPMTMTDLAAAFTQIVPQGTTYSSPVAILCNNYKPQPCLHQVCGSSSSPGQVSSQDMSKCNSPTFVINLDLINIPVINQTATALSHRIIPASGADCALISSTTNGTNIGGLGQTIVGQPVSVLCGIQAAALPSAVTTTNGSVYDSTGANNNVSTPDQVYAYLTTVPLDLGVYDGTNSTNSTSLPSNSTVTNSTTDPSSSSAGGTFSPSNQSTTHQGQLESFPAASPFQSLAGTAVGLVQFNSSEVAYLVSGNYAWQYNSLGFASSAVTAATGPSGANITLSWTSVGSPSQIQSFPVPQNGTVTTAGSLANAVGRNQWQNFSITIPTDPCAVTLFSGKNFQGDAIAIGAGSGNLNGATGGSKMAQSIKFAGGAGAWMFSGVYADDTGRFQNTDVADLSTMPLGVSGSYSQNITALWVTCGAT